MGGTIEISGPELTLGVPEREVVLGKPLLGHVGEEPVMLVRRGERIFALGAVCSHYSGPLAEGRVSERGVHCPWHHACFDLETGAASGPAIYPIAVFEVRLADGKVFVGDKKSPPRPKPVRSPRSVLLVGAGAAAAACAAELRAKGYDGPVTMLGGEGAPGPVDRTNLSKDFLAGNAPEEWVALGGEAYWEELRVELLADDPVARIDTDKHLVRTRSGKELGFEALLLATGAEPRRATFTGLETARAFTLRNFNDARGIIAASAGAKHALVVGASFIGLEAAASLRQRGLEVTVVGPGDEPLARVLGVEVGKLVRQVHEDKGVRFQLGTTVARVEGTRVTLANGGRLQVDFLVVGIGVEPRLDLARTAGLEIQGGVVVDAELRTSVAGIWAAGDIAAYDDFISGERRRVEHWVVAERQGQAAARSMLGVGQPYRDVPFFWTTQHDLTINYTGSAPSFDEAKVFGSLAGRDAAIAYRRAGKTLAVATIGRDRLGLDVAACLERGEDPTKLLS